MDHSSFESTAGRRRLAAALLIALTAALPLRLLAKGCSESLPGQSPQPPATLWGELEPTKVLQNATNWTGSQLATSTYPISTAVDVENGWVFETYLGGIAIWDGRSNPADPTKTVQLGWWEGGIPNTVPAGEFTQIIWSIDAPEGVDSIMAVGGQPVFGLQIWDTTNKTSPHQLYKDWGHPFVYQVYADRIGGRDYAFAAGFQDRGGLYLYDMTAARSFNACVEKSGDGQISCPGVYLGKIGPSADVKYVHGLTVGSRHFVVVSGGSTGSSSGVRIWDVTNPQAPVQVVQDFVGFTPYGYTHGVAMFTQNSHHYLVARRNEQVNVFDVTSCLTTGCSDIGSHQVFSQTVKPGNDSSQWLNVTFSRSGSGTPFIYLGNEAVCRQGKPPGHTEYLFDMSNPASPRDVMPTQTIDDLGVNVDYWSWYYSDFTRGFSQLAGHSGKFNGSYFYRTAMTMFDIHHLTGTAGPPVANFTWSPATVYVGDTVTFTSTSSGAPTAYSWSFADGSPSSGAASSVQTAFTSPGTKTVTLTVTNASSQSDTKTQTVTVIDPAPAIGTVDLSPLAPLTCQPVTFTANNVTGKPPLNVSWTVFNAINSPVATGSGNPFTWNSAGQPQGNYSATVTVSKAGYPDATNSKAFVLGGLPLLPADGTFAPTNDAFAAGTVNFHVAVAGATAWKWDFGDGTAQVWTTDPVAGPNPTHTYTQIGDYNVKVYVKNCVQGEPNGVGSSLLAVHVTSVQPLEIQLFTAVGCQIFCDFQVNQAVAFALKVIGGPTSYDFDWNGDGTFEQPNAAPTTCPAQADPDATCFTHTYTAVALYTPVVRVHRGIETVSLAHPVAINIGTPAPASTSVSGPGSGQINTAYSFSASGSNCTPGATWAWNGGGGTVSGDGSTVSITWTSAGTKTVSASSGNCPTGSASISISSGGGNNGGGLTPAFTFSPSSPQPGQPVSFDATSTGGSPQVFVFEFSDGGTALSATTSHTYANVGTYSVKLTVSKDCLAGVCNSQASLTKTVVVAGQQVTATFDTSAPCSADITGTHCDAEVGQPVSFNYTGTGANTFNWSFDDGTSATGSQVSHTWSAPGARNVILTAGNGTSTSSFSRLLQISGPALPPLVASFTTSPACGGDTCSAVAGQTIAMTSTSTGDPTGQSWTFGDGSSASGAAASHAWSAAGSYVVTLTITRGSETKSVHKTYTVSAAPVGKMAVLPWVIQSNTSDVELSDLYLYNPGPQETHLTLTYHNRGAGTSNPPPMQRTLAAGATLQVLALLGQFSVDNTSGFLSVLAADGEPQPMAVGFHQSFDGSRRFGQVLPGFTLSSTPGGRTVYHLIGLHDTTDRGTTFGATNAGFTSSSYSLRFFDRDGIELGSRPSTALAGNSQEQLDRDAQQTLGVNNDDDYRVEVEVDGGNIFPFAATRWASSDDTDLVTARPEGGRPRQYLLGLFNGSGGKQTQWSSDAVLANPTDQPMAVTLSFVNALGGKSPAPRSKTLQAGQTLRVVDVLNSEFKVKTGAGIVVVDSPGVGGVYPVVLGDTYNKAGSSRFGQVVPSVDDRDAATAGRTQVLIGLQEDKLYKSTMWLHNPAGTPASAELTFRKLDGTVLSRLVVNVGAGKAVQVAARVNKGLPKSFSGAFTVEVKVNAGQLYSGAQVLNKGTNDPAFNLGQLRP
ncbi:MAG TPA: PKD domain-containing protein [Thermoanaerobaculia bacterium]|jgi:PKD repeat protein|nr:PKD domain-containing protein [Thermoanaerobaculia bacterium]